MMRKQPVLPYLLESAKQQTPQICCLFGKIGVLAHVSTSVRSAGGKC